MARNPGVGLVRTASDASKGPPEPTDRSKGRYGQPTSLDGAVYQAGNPPARLSVDPAPVEDAQQQLVACLAPPLPAVYKGQAPVAARRQAVAPVVTRRSRSARRTRGNVARRGACPLRSPAAGLNASARTPR